MDESTNRADAVHFETKPGNRLKTMRCIVKLLLNEVSASKINIIGKNWPWSFLSIKTVKDCVSWCFFREISGGGNPFYHQQTRFTAKSLHAVYSALCKACFLQSQRLFLLILHHTSQRVIRFDGFLYMWVLNVAECILLKDILLNISDKEEKISSGRYLAFLMTTTDPEYNPPRHQTPHSI